MAVFRTDFSGRGELADRQQKLNQLLNRLRKLADEFNIAVFYTNQVMSDPSGGTFYLNIGNTNFHQFYAFFLPFLLPKIQGPCL